MAKSTQSRRSVKAKKPYDGFPLFPHSAGVWAKKIRGKLHYFGSVKDDPEGTRALGRFNREWPYLKEGRTPPPVSTGEYCSVRDLVNAFLNAKRVQMDGGELSAHSFGEYYRSCQRLIEHFGEDRRVDDLRPDDFERFRAALGMGCNVVTLKSKINRLRVIFKYASDNRLIGRPVEYGSAFNRPAAKTLRKARNEAGPRMFSREELQSILGKSGSVLRAMILLGVNCGFGNTDVANLPQSAVDLDAGWIVYPRPKTEIMRRIPLWTETAVALREAIERRPKPKCPSDDDLCFLTGQGNRFMRVQNTKGQTEKYVTINAVARRFESAMNAAGVERRKGIGFYTLRHVFETIGGEAKDQTALDAIMGHVDSSMAGQYREWISDDRLKAVVETVRTWLWPEG